MLLEEDPEKTRKWEVRRWCKLTSAVVIWWSLCVATATGAQETDAEAAESKA